MSATTDFLASHDLQPSKALQITITVLQIFTAVAFVAAGFAKLSSAGLMVDMFEKIGLGQSFRYVTGCLEISGALLFLFRKTAIVGGWLLAAVMVAAIAMHLFIIGGSPAPAAILLSASLIVTWYRLKWF